MLVRCALAALLLAACGADDARDSVLSYAWNGGPPVPRGAGETVWPPPMGRAGQTPATRLLLTFEQEFAREMGRPEQAFELVTGEHARAAEPGPYGSALQLAERSHVRFRRTPAWAGHGPWTLELRLRPRAGATGRIVTLPGRLTLDLDATGVFRLAAPGLAPPVRLERARAAQDERWIHLSIVADPRDTRALWLEVDGRVTATAVRTDLGALQLDEFVLGDAEERGAGLACALDELVVQARAANTAESVARGAERPGPGADRLRLETPRGPEELELWHERLPCAPLAPEDWTRGEFEHVLAGPGGLRHVAGQWRSVPACDPPLARTTHPNVALGDGRVLVFGGEVRDSHGGPWVNTAESWILDARAARWTRLETEPAPSPRCHVPLAYSPDHRLVLLHGGWNNEGGSVRTGDTWVFHVDEGRWEELHPARSPGAMSDQVLVYHPRARRFVLLHGRRAWTFDPETGAWDERARPACVDEQGRPADYRAGSSCAAIDPATGLVLLFGGSSGVGEETLFHDTTALYDLEHDRITVLAPPVAPAPRVRAGLGFDARRARFVLFGGVLGEHSQRMRDLWSFDPATRLWREEEAADTPSERGGYFGMPFDPGTGRFVLACGRRNVDRLVAEAWTLELEPEAVGRARYVFARDLGGAGTRWFAESVTPGGSSVTFRFRASADALHWSEWSESPPAGTAFVQVEALLQPGAQGASPSIHALGFR